MAETQSEEYGTEAGPSEEHSETGDSGSNVEWRSYEQVENGTPSTSPFWDTDSEDDGLYFPSFSFWKALCINFLLLDQGECLPNTTDLFVTDMVLALNFKMSILSEAVLASIGSAFFF
jgi:hypothetical protein